jgi:hypothetical protein
MIKATIETDDLKISVSDEGAQLNLSKKIVDAAKALFEKKVKVETTNEAAEEESNG